MKRGADRQSWPGSVRPQGLPPRVTHTCQSRALSSARLMSSVKDNVGRGLNIALVNGESQARAELGL